MKSLERIVRILSSLAKIKNRKQRKFWAIAKMLLIAFFGDFEKAIVPVPKNHSVRNAKGICSQVESFRYGKSRRTINR